MSADLDLPILDETPQTDEETFVLPDEALAEAAASAPAALDGLTRERLDELNADPSLAKPEEMKLVQEYVLGGRKWPEAAAPATETAEETEAREANEAAAAAAEAPAAGAATVATPEEDEADDETDLHRSTLDAVATLRAAHKTEIDRLNAIIKAPKPEDKYSPEYDAWLEARDAAIIEKSDLQDSFHEKVIDAQSAAQAQTVATREAERTWSSFDKVSAKHPEVKLDRPFKAANAAYAAWLNSLPAKAGITDGTDAEKVQAAYAKYQSDPAFAATVPPPKDLKQVQLLNEARILSEKAKGVINTDEAMTVVLQKHGLLDKRTGAAAVAASQAAALKTQDALRRQHAAPQTAPLGGASKAPKVLAVPVDQETATAYMTNLLDKKRRPGAVLTAFETRYEDEAKRLIGVDKIR